MTMAARNERSRLGSGSRLLTAVVALALGGCTAALDFNSLQGGGKDGAGDAAGDTGRPDQGGCIAGETCTVFSAQGECRRGKKSCGEAGVGLCVQTVQPDTETCDGKDADCDGLADGDDPDADKACGPGKYCDGNACVAGCDADTDCTNGNTCNKTTKKCVCGSGGTCGAPRACVAGACLCAGKFRCAEGETCQAPGKCVCGTHENTNGPYCKAPNPRCIDSACRCDADSSCKTKETCTAGACSCGTKSKPVGPFCPLGTCDPTTEQCAGIPVDAGPDLPRDLGPSKDVGPQPDAPQADAPKPDAPKPVDQGKPDAVKLLDALSLE